MRQFPRSIWISGWALMLAGLLSWNPREVQSAPSAGVLESAGSDSASDARRRKELDALFSDPQVAKSQISAEVFSITRGVSVYQRNRDLALIPASTVKVLSGYAALKHLGPDHVFVTRVFTDGTVKGSTLEGSVYLKGAGDPSLVSERLFLLAEKFLRSGIRTVKGDIIVDSSIYEDGHFHESRLLTDTDRPFNAPTSALSFNYNTTAVFVSPGEKAGAPARYSVEPDTGYVKVVNRAKTVAKGSESIVASREAIEGGDRVVISGNIPLGNAGRMKYLNVTSPEVYAGQAFHYYLDRFGVKFQKSVKVRRGLVPASASETGSIESLPVRDIVTLMNKYSNNFIAEALVKAVGGQLEGFPTSLDKGVRVLKAEASALGITDGGFQMASPSGLSRDNRMSAAHFTRLIRASYADLQIQPELFSSFPIAGRDGTLEGRMLSTNAAGRLRAKTGSLDGVSSLVGLIQSSSGEILSFSLLINDPKLNHWNLRSWQARFGEALVR